LYWPSGPGRSTSSPLMVVAALRQTANPGLTCSIAFPCPNQQRRPVSLAVEFCLPAQHRQRPGAGRRPIAGQSGLPLTQRRVIGDGPGDRNPTPHGPQAYKSPPQPTPSRRNLSARQRSPNALLDGTVRQESSRPIGRFRKGKGLGGADPRRANVVAPNQRDRANPGGQLPKVTILAGKTRAPTEGKPCFPERSFPRPLLRRKTGKRTAPAQLRENRLLPLASSPSSYLSFAPFS